MTPHGVLYAGPTGNGGGIEMVCHCGAIKSQWGGVLPSIGTLLAEHITEVQAAQVEATLADAEQAELRDEEKLTPPTPEQRAEYRTNYDLQAEVRRLRDGIQALADGWFEDTECLISISKLPVMHVVEALRSLLGNTDQ